MSALLGFVLVFSCTPLTLGADILVVHPIPVYSHTVPFRPVFEELAARGHNVTLITPFAGIIPGSSLRELKMNLTNKILLDALEAKIGPITSKDCSGLVYHLQGISNICVPFANILIDYLKPLLPPPSARFDLLVVEPYFCQEWAVGLGEHYKAPVIATLPQPLTPFIAHSLGNPTLSSYVPNFRLAMTAEMSFLERVKNTFVDMFEIFWIYFYHLPNMDALMRDLLERDLPPLSELLSSVALVLSGAHFSLDYHRPYHKNVIQVGALAVGMSGSLPQDVESFMNGAEEGSIYFSWGSHFEAEEPERTLKALLGTFARLKQRVIFKWHTTDLKDVPSNVLIRTWLPQTEILKHEKLRVFISHCGLNSVSEAAYFGVPVVGTPQFGDQHHNSRLLEYLGMGVTVDPDVVLDSNTLFNAIQRVLTDPSFKENAVKRMKIMREEPMNRVEEAAYWIEYVLKHGADSLRPASTRMSWFRLNLVDVYIFIFLILLLAVSLPLFLLRRLLSISSLSKQKKD